MFVLAACGKSKTEDPIAQLATLKEQKTALESQINTLEKQLQEKGLIEKKTSYRRPYRIKGHTIHALH